MTIRSELPITLRLLDQKRSRFKFPGVAIVLLGLYVARGVVLLCVVPPFAMWDEYSHLAYVDFWAANHRPAVYGQTDVNAAFLAVGEKCGGQFIE